MHGSFSPAGDEAGKYQHPLVFHKMSDVTRFGTITIGVFEFDAKDVNSNLNLCPEGIL